VLVTALDALTATLAALDPFNPTAAQYAALHAQAHAVRAALVAYWLITPNLHPAVIAAMTALTETIDQLLAASRPTKQLCHILDERTALAAHALTTTPPKRTPKRTFWT
jgi:hypothetical protein